MPRLASYSIFYFLIIFFLPSRYLRVNPPVKRLMECFFQNYNSCLSWNISFKITTMFLSEWIQSDSPMSVQNKSGKLLHKQECIMADKSAQIRLVLWEDDIVINKSYKLDKMKIRMYNDVKYLSVSSCTTIESIGDIGHVANLSSDSELIPDRGNRLFNGSIVAVVSTDIYTSCINCKGKVNTLTSIIGQCNRCKANATDVRPR